MEQLIDLLILKFRLHLNRASVLLFITLIFSGIYRASASEKEVLLEETNRLLSSMEAHILSTLKTEEGAAQLEQEQVIEDIAPHFEQTVRQKQARDNMLFRRNLLVKKVDGWARSNAVILEFLETDELQLALTKAHEIAAYFGLDIEKLRVLYELGKKSIRKADFVLPDRLPPDKREVDATYYDYFFRFAFQRTEDIAKYRENTQRYKLVLYKRVTLAYLRALLSSGEKIAKCNTSAPGRTVVVNETRIKSFDCRDPVLDNLRRYVLAVQKIASADSDVFSSHAEIVIAEQTAINTVIAGVPLVGDAIDYYSLYAGEDLAGECLTRSDLAITAIFSIIPFIPASWWTQAVNRMGLEEPLSKLVLLVADSANASSAYMAGLARRVGLTTEDFVRAQSAFAHLQTMLSTDINIRAAGIEIRPSQLETTTRLPRLDENLSAQQIVQRNTMMAFNSQRALRELPQSMLARMKRTSQRIMDANLNRLQKNVSHIIDQSNMVSEHLLAFTQMAKDKGVVVGFRSVNPDATKLIAANAPTKWMNVKPKSSGWGQHRGYLPYEQKFSKIMDPDTVKQLSPKELTERLAKAEEFTALSDKCLKHPDCFKINLVLPEPDNHAVMIWSKADGSEIPILKSPDGKYFDADTRSPISIANDAVRPMEVMAAKNKLGELVPLTADYDLLAVGTKSDIQRADYTDFTGFRTDEEQNVIGWINEYGKKAGYEGGNLSHHGPENQFYKSPGALAEDTVMTMVDPIRGMTTVPRCDFDCMVLWCKTSGQCGALPICIGKSPQPPCISVDPDRLLKDYFQEMRLEGYSNLRPNKVWDWGKSNGLGGWQPKVLLEAPTENIKTWMFGQYTPLQGITDTLREIPFERWSKGFKQITMKATKLLFECPENPSIKQRVHKWVEGG